MLRLIQQFSLCTMLGTGTILCGQYVLASGAAPASLPSALLSFQPVNNQLPKADPRRYSPPAATYQRHARDYSHLLYYYGNSPAGLKPSQARQFVGEIKKNLDSCNSELKTIQESHPQDTQVKQATAKIQQHHAKVLEHCAMIYEESEKSKVDNVKICDCCVDIDEELNAAQIKSDALLKQLKLDNVPAMRRSTDRTVPK